MTNQPTNGTNRDNGKAPDYVVKTAKKIGNTQRLDRIGAAWKRDDQGICVRLSGTQLVTEDIYLFPITDPAEATV